MPHTNLFYICHMVLNLQAASTPAFDTLLGAPIPPERAHLAHLPLMVLSGQSSYCMSCRTTHGVPASLPEAPVPSQPSSSAATPHCSLQVQAPLPNMIDIKLSLTRQLWSLVLDPAIVGQAPGPAAWLETSCDTVVHSWADMTWVMMKLMRAMQLQTHYPGER
jgi:hypothetical protein